VWFASKKHTTFLTPKSNTLRINALKGFVLTIDPKVLTRTESGRQLID